MAPTTATSRLYRFNPVTPLEPKAVNSHPPTIAPTTPRTISSISPSPRLLTILLPMNPATRPSTIHARNDILLLLLTVIDCFPANDASASTPDVLSVSVSAFGFEAGLTGTG